MILYIDHNDALQLLTINVNLDTYNVPFKPEQRLPGDLRRQAPAWLEQADSHEKSALPGTKRTITPPFLSLIPKRNTGVVPDQTVTGWSHSGLQRQAQADQSARAAIETSLAQFGMDWHALTPQQQGALWNAALHVPAGERAGATRQEQLHAVLLPVQLAQSMAWLSSQRQEEPVTINATYFLRGASQPTAYYTGVTVDDAHQDADGNLHFYLEQQQNWACAQHGANAMIGAPRLSLYDFARIEAAGTYGDPPTPEQVQATETILRAQGVRADTVDTCLQQTGIATHRFSSIPVLGPNGTLQPGHDQFAFLDTLNTDRLLLQSDITLNDQTGASHWVAFRRVGAVWVLLDSLHDTPQSRVSPSAYLFNEGASHFTALWPQGRLSTIQSAVTSAYDIQIATDQWKGKRATELEPLRKSWNAATRQNRSGPALLMHLSTLCDAELDAGQGSAVPGSNDAVFEFRVIPHGGMPQQKLWRGFYDIKTPNLRLAPEQDDEAACAALLERMEADAKINADKKWGKPTPVFFYDNQKAANHWRGARAAELEPLLKSWNAATGLRRSGPMLLVHLSALCDEELDAGRGMELPDTDGVVFEFTVTPHEGMPQQKLWRGLYDNQTPNLRRAPAENDEATRAAVLDAMHKAAKISAGREWNKPTSGFSYDNKAAKAHWKGARAIEFEPMLKSWNETANQTLSGGMLLMHLSALCDEVLSVGGGRVVPGSNDTVLEFTVTPHEGMLEQKLWRGFYDNGAPNLRLAPEQSDVAARAALLKAMRDAVKMGIGQKWGMPVATFGYNTQKASSHWTGTRAAELEPLLKSWNTATGVSRSGAVMLVHLSELCDAEIIAGRGMAVPGSSDQVFEFSVTPCEEMPLQRLWRGLNDNGTPNLRLAPAQNDEAACSALLDAMQKSANKSFAKTRKKSEITLSYDSSTAKNHWKGKRAEELNPLLESWNIATRRNRNGPALLLHLSALCDIELDAGRAAAVPGSDGRVLEFRVTPHAGMPPQTLWRRLNDNETPNLRLAPAQNDEAVRTDLLKAMQVSAKTSAGQKQNKSALTLPYDSQSAGYHWRGARARELDSLLKSWNKATGESKSGPAMLVHLSGLCDAEIAADRFTEVPNSFSEVSEFTVTLHPGIPAQRLWRGLYENGTPNIRRAPAKDDDAARTALIKAMEQAVNKSAGQKRNKPTDTVPYNNKNAKGHWTGSRAKELTSLLEFWTGATGKRKSGAELLQHLSALCDNEHDEGRGTEVPDSDGVVFEFSVSLHPRMPLQTLWRGISENGTINLRRAPAQNDDSARLALLKAMREAAKISSIKKPK